VTARFLTVGSAIAASLIVVGVFILGQRRNEAELRELRQAVAQQGERMDHVLRAQGASLAASDDIQRKLRDLSPPSASGSAKEALPVAKPAEDHPAPPEPEVLARIESSKQFLQGAVRSGQWTDDNRNELRRYLSLLPPVEADALMHQLVEAINSHRLQIQSVPPF
jgi:hypothetical protein